MYMLDELYDLEIGGLIWVILSVILSIVGGFLVYFMFVKSNEKFESKFLNWLRDFLDFKKMSIEVILKITYIISAISLTLESFLLIGASFIAFLLVLVFGNVLLRVVYELISIRVMIWKNTAEINKKLK